MPGTTETEKPRPRIVSAVVTVACDLCGIEDEWEFDADDIKAGAEFISPCACGQRVGVSMDAFAQYHAEHHPDTQDPAAVAGECLDCFDGEGICGPCPAAPEEADRG